MSDPLRSSSRFALTGRSVKKKKEVGKKGQSKKKPPSKPKPNLEQPEAQSSSKQPPGRAPAVGKPAKPAGVGGGGGLRLRDPLAIDFGDSDLSISDLEVWDSTIYAPHTTKLIPYNTRQTRHTSHHAPHTTHHSIHHHTTHRTPHVTLHMPNTAPHVQTQASPTTTTTLGCILSYTTPSQPPTTRSPSTRFPHPPSLATSSHPSLLPLPRSTASPHHEMLFPPTG